MEIATWEAGSPVESVEITARLRQAKRRRITPNGVPNKFDEKEAPIVQAIIGLTTLLSLDSLHPQLGKSL